MAAWLLRHWGKSIVFGVGKLAIAALWCNNQFTVQLVVLVKVEEAAAVVAVLHGHTHQRSTRERSSA